MKTTPRLFSFERHVGWLAFLALCAAGFVSRAAANNPKTDWLQRAGYGVFVHYLEDLQNEPGQIHSLGRETSWDACVRDFDVRPFAEAMGEAGAGYVEKWTCSNPTRFAV